MSGGSGAYRADRRRDPTPINSQRWKPIWGQMACRFTLWERGSAHEAAYVEHLKASSLLAVRIDGVDISDKTLQAMREGVAVIN